MLITVLTFQMSPRLSVLNYYHFSFNMILLNGRVSNYILLSNGCIQHTEVLRITEHMEQLILTISLCSPIRGKVQLHK